jgi:putative spermidine/putrescine transport system ATP-binding protein
MTALSFNGVRKTFGSTVALHGLDLDIHDGEMITLLGPSGCGKTTALRIAAGFEFADSGVVTVGGTDISGTPAHKRNMGMVFQSYSLFPNLNVADNIEFGLRTRKMAKPDRVKRVNEMISLVQLGEFAKRYPHQLSGGQQQRVALARALAVQPRVLLLDEPLSALDAKVRATLRDEIKRIQSELGITTLFVTHDQDEALAISDRIGVMSSGRLEQLGTPVEIYRRPSTAFVARFIGSMNELRGVVTGDAVDVLACRIPVPTAAEMSTGTPVSLLVRPEDCGLSTNQAEGLSGTITAVTFQGATTIVAIRLDVLDQLVNVETRAGLDPVIGARISVTIDGSRAVCELVGTSAATTTAA